MLTSEIKTLLFVLVLRWLKGLFSIAGVPGIKLKTTNIFSEGTGKWNKSISIYADRKKVSLKTIKRILVKFYL